MSLFRFVDWVSHTIPTASAVLNASFYQEREQLVVGTENGEIHILDPGCREKIAERKTNHVLVTTKTNFPVLQVVCCDFIAGLDNVLAVLSPQKLTYIQVNCDEEDPSKSSLEEIFSHTFATSAWNMCVIPQEEASPQILVQSIDCKLSLFQGEQCVFSLVPLRALHPGPIGYCQTNQTLFAANNGFLAAIKFTLMSSGSQKKINSDWVFNLGDTAIQMEVTEGSKPTTIVLCRRHVSAFNPTGNVIWQIRLEAVGMSMCLYRSLLINNTQFNRLIIATADDTLLIFQDNKLVWNCNAQMSPVALLVCSYNKSYENTITMMSNDGRIVVGYLGTEPSLYKVPVDKHTIDIGERLKNYKELEKKINAADAARGAIRRKEAIQMRLSIGEIGNRTIEANAASNAPFCHVIVELAELQTVTRVQVNIHSECATPSNQLVLNVPSAQSTAKIQIPFYVGAKKSPTSSKVTIAAHCYSSQMTVTKSIDIPFKVLFEDSQVDRNARYKVTIETGGAVVPVNRLFAEYESENPQAIGFMLHGTDKTVSVFAAQKSNRYRIQSEHIPLLQMTSNELIKRIRDASPGMEIGASVPFEYMRDTLETIHELETASGEMRKRMDSRSKEVRAMEALSLNSCKIGNMTNLAALDTLFEKSYRELLDVMDDYNKISAKIDNERGALNSLFQLAADFSKLSKIETIVNGAFWVNTQQTLRERLQWAVRSERGSEMAMIEKLCEHAPKELPKIREEHEEPRKEPA